MHFDVNAFADAHPFLAWCALWLLWGVFAACSYLITVGRMLLRAVVIALRGWPPAHLDADGDHKPQKPAAESHEGDPVPPPRRENRARPGDADYLPSIDG